MCFPLYYISYCGYEMKLLFYTWQIYFLCSSHAILLHLQCTIFPAIAFDFPHSSVLFLKALLQFQFPHAIQLPKEGNSIITCDPLSCVVFYRNAINIFAERHHAAARHIILYHLSCCRLLLWHICCLYYYKSLKETELVPWTGIVLTEWPMMI